jgi:hypothetical protein
MNYGALDEGRKDELRPPADERQPGLLEAYDNNHLFLPWVYTLPLRCQGLLATGMRGGDLTVKPHDHNVLVPERQLVAFMRYCCCVPVDYRELDTPGAFFQRHPPDPKTWKASGLGHHPWHFISHLMHCFELIGYKHPHSGVRFEAMNIYCRFVASMHLNVELEQQMMDRLTDDRIAGNCVVS